MNIGSFSASESVLGYVYQFRWALLLAIERMRENPDHAVSIELIDDVAFESEDGVTTVVQTKHHLDRGNPLTDLSPDIWKTLRIWSIQLKEGIVDPSSTVHVLVTTANTPEGSAASFLKDDARDPDEALHKLLGASSKSSNAELKSAFEEFQGLTQAQQLALLGSCYIADSQPTADQMRAELEEKLKLTVNRDRVSLLTDRLEGWWFDQVIRSLSTSPNKAIPLFAIDRRLDELREEFRSTNLPIDYRDLVPGEEQQTGFLSMTFVEQLRLIGANHQLIDAIKDYYRAFTQRNRWVSDNLLYINDLEDYERRLKEAWQSQYNWMLDELGDDAAEDEMKRRGRELLKWVIDVPDNLHIKPECTEPYVVRGNFHILADGLYVGWHPRFAERMSQLLEEAVR